MSEISSATFVDRTVMTDARYKSESRQVAEAKKEVAEKAVRESAEAQNQGGDPNRGRNLSALV